METIQRHTLDWEKVLFRLCKYTINSVRSSLFGLCKGKIQSVGSHYLNYEKEKYLEGETSLILDSANTISRV